MSKRNEKAERRWLLGSLQFHVIPTLEDRGFVSVPLDGADSRSREIRLAFPFGEMRRDREGVIDIAEIQFDKWASAAFRINFGTTPQGGIEHALGHVPAKEVRVHYLDENFALYDWPFFLRWFSVRRWSRQEVTERDYEELARRVAGIVPEIDQMLLQGKRGAHVKVVR